ncbi:hypothetical protein BH11PSE11_BH11PSE11_29090 [soil metagenome]
MNHQERYLSLLKKSLLNELYLEDEARIVYLVLNEIMNQKPPPREWGNTLLTIKSHPIYKMLAKSRLVGGFIQIPGQAHARNYTETPHTMIGRARLDNIHHCLDQIVADEVPGDVIETGVWKGGATIFMRGFFAAHDIRDRKVWVADSFEGLPKPTHEADAGWDLSKEAMPFLAVSLDDVKELFARYDLLDEQVEFLKGWFKDTLPVAPIGKLALIRLDGDLYESTMDAITSLYDKLADGGFLIIDDYILPPCKKAITDFRDARGISKDIITIDEQSAFWRK